MEKKDYRLAAILYTDIAGFSKMMEKNEALTLELLNAHNRIVEDVVAAKGGKVIKTIGDAFLLDFKNTVDALQSAMDIQYRLYEYNREHPDLPLLVRIGLHLGTSTSTRTTRWERGSTSPPGSSRSRTPAASACPETCTITCSTRWSSRPTGSAGSASRISPRKSTPTRSPRRTSSSTQTATNARY
jgi:hypothetical protein